MNKGGYKIIDLKDEVLTVDAVTADVIPGIYEEIESSYRKSMILSGISLKVVNTVTEYPDVPISVTVDSGDFVFTAYGYNWTVDDDDKVVVATPI